MHRLIWRAAPLRAAAAALAALFLALGLVACDDEESAGADAGATLQSVVDDEGDLDDKVVTVSAEIHEVLGTGAFVLRDGDARLLVVGAPSAGGRLVEEGAAVEVTGQVRDVEPAELERRKDIDVDDELLARHEGENMIVADVVTPVDGDRLR